MSSPSAEAVVIDIEGRLSSAELRRLLNHWLDCKGEAEAPPHPRGIDPALLDYIMDNLVIADVVRGAPGTAPRFRYRHTGRVLYQRLGIDRDLNGTLVDEHPDPDYRALAQAAYERVAESGRPALARRDTVLDGRMRFYESLQLPWSSGGGVVDVVTVAMWFLAR